MGSMRTYLTPRGWGLQGTFALLLLSVHKPAPNVLCIWVKAPLCSMVHTVQNSLSYLSTQQAVQLVAPLLYCAVFCCMLHATVTILSHRTKEGPIDT